MPKLGCGAHVRPRHLRRCLDILNRRQQARANSKRPKSDDASDETRPTTATAKPSSDGACLKCCACCHLRALAPGAVVCANVHVGLICGVQQLGKVCLPCVQYSDTRMYHDVHAPRPFFAVCHTLPPPPPRPAPRTPASDTVAARLRGSAASGAQNPPHAAGAACGRPSTWSSLTSCSEGR